MLPKRWLIVLAALAAGGLALAAPASGFDATPTGFGFHTFEASLSNTQAGSHPNLTVTLEFNSVLSSAPDITLVGGEARNLSVNLPPGLVGNPTAVPQCTRQQLDAEACPGDTQIGVDTIGLGGTGGSSLFLLSDVPVYNMVPPASHPAEFDFNILGIDTFLDSGVRSGTDDGITTHIDNIAQRAVVYNTITIFGEVEGHPLLTAPTSCGAPLQFSAAVSTWEEAGALAHASTTGPAITGCQRLVHFEPSLTALPDTSFADTPAGLSTEVKIPQGENPEGLADAGLQETKVVLPEGVAINPGQAAGLQACQPEQEGLGVEPDGESKEGPAECPGASKVGTVEVETPLLKDTLKGDVYVLASDPPHLQVLLTGSADGVNLKLVGDIELDEATGRLIATFANTPDVPVSDIRLTFSGGAQAALSTPTACGLYSTTGEFTPWSSPFIPEAFSSSAFQITAGPQGGACPSSPLPFAPEMIAGSTTDQAGGFTGFTMLLRRGDGQQRIERLQFKAPEGLAGMISSVPLCTNAQAEADACPESSMIGHTVVTAGPGPFPLVIPEPGQPLAPIYLTEGYAGAPFGLAIVVPLHVGPFTLQTQKVRAKIAIDPRTAQITVTTEPLPQVVDGVPTDLRSVDAVIDRNGFMFNPTNCEASEFSGTAWGTPPPGQPATGTTAPLSSHFGVGSCRSLEFKPSIAVATAGAASKADGASLSFKIAYPKGAQGDESWFNEAKFDLPIQLPARLTTLQQACLAATFEANPASCPAASLIGHAAVHTPVLPVPLQGPVYFVSYGGAKFPEAVVVLTGDNVTVDLHGETFIAKSGVTSATFKNTPDVPFESIEVSIPTGPYSEFGTNLPAKDKYNLCGQKLVMPTFFKAQNGLEINANTPISITGCPKALTRTQKLSAALRTCHKKHGVKRASCETTARKAYGAKASKNSKKRT
jgi:hypothetical protein